MRKLRIGIAGGGIGAMVAALLLARDGHQVSIHERSDQLGGRLRFAELGRFRIDQGPTIVLLPDLLLGLLREAGVPTDRIELVRCDPMYRIHYGDGTVFEKWSAPDKQLEEISRVFPGEEEGFVRYMRDHDEAFPQGRRAFLERPFLKPAHAFSRQSVRLLLRMRAYRSVRSQARAYFRDPRLADAFSLQSLYIGGGPHLTPALYSFIPYAEHRFGVWYVKGGYASLLPLLHEALLTAGVKIHLQSEVRGIRIQSGDARGLETNAGYQPYDAVVYNGDYPNLSKLLPEAAQSRKSRRAFTPSSGCLLVYVGANRRWPEAGAYQFLLPERFDRGLRRMFKEGTLPRPSSCYIFNPVALDPNAAPNGESVLYVMIPAPPAPASMWKDQDQAVESLIEEVLEHAERRSFPGLRASIVERRIRTPLEAQSEGLYQGGSFGIAPTLAQSGWMRPQIKPLPIGRLYAVGASIHPGGGVPVVMQGAKLLAEQIRKELSDHDEYRVSGTM